MFETTGTKTRFFDNLTGFERTAEDIAPTFDRTLDSYFDRNFESIIQEWGLITDADLIHYKRKLDYLSYEVGRLVNEKDAMKSRFSDIERAISELEGKV